jgi:hypothetical protein
VSEILARLCCDYWNNAIPRQENLPNVPRRRSGFL